MAGALSFDKTITLIHQIIFRIVFSVYKIAIIALCRVALEFMIVSSRHAPLPDVRDCCSVPTTDHARTSPPPKTKQPGQSFCKGVISVGRPQRMNPVPSRRTCRWRTGRQPPQIVENIWNG